MHASVRAKEKLPGRAMISADCHDLARALLRGSGALLEEARLKAGPC